MAASLGAVDVEGVVFMSSDPLSKSYEPQEVESRWYRYWEQEQLFSAEEDPTRRSFSIVIPPPNVTGVLHMGHALNNTLQDILCRYRRLRGDNVLWMPGTDHAGIATQNVVERSLAAEGLDRHQIGRENFIEAVWQWRQKYGSAIINQLKRLGASCDWQRERFTMDDGLSLAVRTVFVKLYEDGLIYRGNYIINWCPRCATALADLEVEHEETEGRLYHIRYPYTDGSGDIIVATTRPETMLGDTAVAVHPEDDRYPDSGAREVTLPLMNRTIPIIRDAFVDRSFGTGALKVTPAHDPNDYEIGLRHKLPLVKVIDDDGRMTSEAGRFEGLERFECRSAVVDALRNEGYLGRIEEHNHSVGHCYRCKEVVEPNLSRQWFVKTKPLAEKAVAAVRNGKTRIIPEIWTHTYYDWMENVRDWCISRQIWWGHQIPAWTCADCQKIVVAVETPTRCPSCGNGALVQDTDVLDTWFSSALWPFSTMGWPGQTPLLNIFYPTSTLVTGFDILFFWVARMMMMGIHFMEDVPFRDVYVHALVRDAEGKKMSKSKGNVIDPLNVIDSYGTDAFRFTLAAFAAQGRDIKMSEKRIEGYRHFINKLWNAGRLCLMHLTDARTSNAKAATSDYLPDRWIQSRLHALTTSVTDALEGYRFNEAAGALYNFVWHEFCDWYLEAIKPVLYDKTGPEQKAATLAVLKRVLRDTLVLLHPFIPFVTEEIWSQLPDTNGSIMTAAYPLEDDLSPALASDPEAESEMKLLNDIITGVRNIRGEMDLPPSLKLNVEFQAEDNAVRETVDRQRDLIINLARVSEVTTRKPGRRPAAAATTIIDGGTIFVPLEGIIDLVKEMDRLQKRISKVDADLAPIVRKLNNEDFLNKAPENVVANVQEKKVQLQLTLDKLQATLAKVREMAHSR
jgi:valyl-tRNA synthetase